MARGCKTSKVLLGEMVAAVSRAQLSPHVGAATGSPGHPRTRSASSYRRQIWREYIVTGE